MDRETRWPAAAALASAMACSQEGTEVPRWSVTKGFLRDAQGRAVIMRGANVSGKDGSRERAGGERAC